MKRILFPPFITGIICFICLVYGCSEPAKNGPDSVKQVKLTRFEMQSSALISSSGDEISNAGYKPDVYWFPVNVPATVLSGLVANNVYPDPYSGLNNMLIPDASDELNKKYNLEQFSHLPNEPNPWKKPYWYRTLFHIPAEDSGRHFQIIFKGINYRAAVWINGKQITDSTRMAGMFAEYSLDVSRLVNMVRIMRWLLRSIRLIIQGCLPRNNLQPLGISS